MYRGVTKRKTKGACDTNWIVGDDIVAESITEICCKTSCKYILKIAPDEGDYIQEVQANQRLIKHRLYQPYFPAPKMHDHFVDEGLAHIIFDKVKINKKGVIDSIDVVVLLNKLRSAGVTHGDIHPGNIVLDSSGKINIIDFGNSNLYDDDGRFVGQVYFSDQLPTPLGVSDLQYRFLLDVGAAITVFSNVSCMDGREISAKTGLYKRDYQTALDYYKVFVTQLYGSTQLETKHLLLSELAKTRKTFFRSFPKYDYHRDWDTSIEYKYSLKTIEANGDRATFKKFNTLGEVSAFLGVSSSHPLFKKLKNGLIVKGLEGGPVRPPHYLVTKGKESSKYAYDINTEYATAHKEYDDWIVKNTYNTLSEAVQYEIEHFIEMDAPLGFLEKRSLRNLNAIRGDTLRILINPK